MNMPHARLLALLLTVCLASAAPVSQAAEGSQLQWTVAAVSDKVI